MKFIFPQNYNFSSKLLGLIDYSTAILNFILFFTIFFITKLFNFSLLIRLAISGAFVFPILLLSIFGFYQEKFIYIIKYLYVFLKSQKVYLYTKYY